MSTNLDFDYLSELYQTDPEQFEALRAKEIEKLIEGASAQNKKRLQGLQFQIDAKRKIHADSPIGSCIAISKMMQESFGNLRFHLNQALDKTDPLGHQPFKFENMEDSEVRSATVIKLHG
jgi:hypothetical protein